MTPGDLLKTEWCELTRINPSARPWQMPFAAGLITGLPLFAGAALGTIDHGIAAMLGTLIFLYIPDASLRRRMAVLAGCAGAMTACYALGLLAGHLGPWALPILGLVAFSLTTAARAVRLSPPAGLFFIMAASVGAYAEMSLDLIPLSVALLTLGTLLALGGGLAYALLVPGNLASETPPPLTRETLLLDPAIIGFAVMLSLLLAEALGVERPYWAPISCLAVIQGASIRAIWTRQSHRVIGTALGLVLASAVMILPLSGWSVAIAITLLIIVVEAAVVRHYGFAVMFITPMSILIAEAPRLGAVDVAALMQARLLDTVIGCAVGVVFGMMIHHTGLKSALKSFVRIAP